MPMKAVWMNGVGLIGLVCGCWESEPAPAEEPQSCPAGPSGAGEPACLDVPAVGTGSINIDGEVTYLKVMRDAGGGQIDEGDRGQLTDITLMAVDGDTALESVWLMVIMEEGEVTGVDVEVVFDGEQGGGWTYAPALGDDGEALNIDFTPETASPTRLGGQFHGELIGSPLAPLDAIEVMGQLDVCVYECSWSTE